MKSVHGFSWLILSTLVLDDFSNLLKFTNDPFLQEPEYITQAKKDIIGVWYQEDEFSNILEFKEGVTLICRNAGEPALTFTFKIVNTTPICGQDVDLDEKRETMYLVTKDADGIEECSEIYFDHEKSNARMKLWALGRTAADGMSFFVKKTKTRVEKF
jgi:hypothetical protein